MPTSADITILLEKFGNGDSEAINVLFDIVYYDMHRLAHAQLRKLRPGDTINTTGLVHKLYLKLVNQNTAKFNNRAHFFSVAAKAMRHIIYNYAKRKMAKKHGGELKRLNLDDIALATEEQAEVIVALDESMQELANINERLSKVVEMRFYGGMTEREIGHVLCINERTVRRDWTKARTILSRMMETDY